MVGEVQVVLGVAARPAGRLVDLAHRLTTVLPDTLDALAAGRLDLVRVRLLVEATQVLSDRDAREVQDRLLAVAGSSPWDGPSPRCWRDRTARTVTRVDADAAARRRRSGRAARSVRSPPTGAGMAELIVGTDAADVAMTEPVLTDLAQARDDPPSDGDYVRMDQRRVDAFVELFRRVRDGDPLPGVSVRRVRELGLVLHADTFFGTGPAAQDPGEVRGLTGQAVLDPVTAREQAHAMAATGATNVLLVDRAGVLTRVVRLPPHPPAGGPGNCSTGRSAPDWPGRPRRGDPATGRLPALSTESYAPTVAITEHVRARNPRCTAYDCPTRAHRCDLDHDVPWPRGPTEVDNLAPRHRRHHELKTRGLVATRLNQDGSVEHTHAHRTGRHHQTRTPTRLRTRRRLRTGDSGTRGLSDDAARAAAGRHSTRSPHDDSTCCVREAAAPEPPGVSRSAPSDAGGGAGGRARIKEPPDLARILSGWIATPRRRLRACGIWCGPRLV